MIFTSDDSTSTKETFLAAQGLTRKVIQLSDAEQGRNKRTCNEKVFSMESVERGGGFESHKATQ